MHHLSKPRYKPLLLNGLIPSSSSQFRSPLEVTAKPILIRSQSFPWFSPAIGGFSLTHYPKMATACTTVTAGSQTMPDLPFLPFYPPKSQQQQTIFPWLLLCVSSQQNETPLLGQPVTHQQAPSHFCSTTHSR